MNLIRTFFLTICLLPAVASAMPYDKDPIVRKSITWTRLDAKQLLQARSAYWDGAPLVAITYYQHLIRVAPFDHLPDLYGELGNCYDQIGAYFAAGAAYGKCAQFLIYEKKFSGARQILTIVREFNPDKAQKLRIEIHQQESLHHDRKPDNRNLIEVSAPYRGPY